MKILAMVLLATAVRLSASYGVQLGHTEAEVVAAIGRPDGVIETERFTWFHYRRGVVKFEEGKVVEADLLTPEQLAERDARDRADWVRNQQIWQERERRRQALEAAQARAAHEREAARRERAFDQRISELEAQVRLAEVREREAAQRAFRQPVVHHVGAPIIYHAPAAPVVWSRPARGVALGVSPNDRVVFSASYLDHVFGPMPMHTGYGGSAHGRSGLTGNVRVDF